MHIYAIGDLHLSLSSPKPMDVFGPAWADHAQRLADAWTQQITNDDLVLIPGDISWAMQLCDAAPDLAFIGSLPGQKLLLRGNHDYWWSSISRVRANLPPSMHALQNDVFLFGDYAIAGTRGWTCPGSNGFTCADEKIFAREVQRLSLSLSSLPPDKTPIAMMHFPPYCEPGFDTDYTRLFQQYGVKHVVYAHLHGPAHKLAFIGQHDGINYTFAAADYLQFSPVLVV